MQLINRAQKIALYIFFFSINFEMLVPWSSVDASVAKLTGILYLITVIPQLTFFLKTDNLRVVMLPIWLFFGLLTINNQIYANELSDQVFNQSLILNIMVFWLMISHVRKDYLLMEKAMLGYALGTALLTLLYILGIGVAYEDGRATIFEDNQNAIGLKTSAALIIFLLVIVENRLKLGWYRFMLLIPVPFMLQLLADTGSRVAAISFILAFVIGVVLMKTGSIWNKILIFIGGVIFFTAIAVKLMQTGVLVERLSSTSETGDLGGRAQIWSNIIPLIKDNPIFGVGNTGYDYFYMSNFNVIFSPHNVILEVLCYTGIVGLFLYFAFLYQVFLRGYLSYLKNGLLLPLLLLSPILGMLLSGQILVSKLGWIIFAYIVGSSAIRNLDDRLNQGNVRSKL